MKDHAHPATCDYVGKFEPSASLHVERMVRIFPSADPVQRYAEKVALIG
jgi:hypothetical protein